MDCLEDRSLALANSWPKTIGLAVLTADSIDHLAPADISLRGRDRWIPHARLYRAAMVCAGREDLELVQLNSFGCVDPL
jgi:predicted nucleotide-binding protein (sugar kinase/HSP70/actin superfamily)